MDQLHGLYGIRKGSVKVKGRIPHSPIIPYGPVTEMTRWPTEY